MRWILVLTAACTLPTGDDANEPSDSPADDTVTIEEVEETCRSTVRRFEPIDSATDVVLEIVINVTFDDVLPEDAVLEVTGPDGTVEGEHRRGPNGRALSFVPDELQPLTTYTVRAPSCDITEEASFTTGLRPIVPEDLVGNTWVVRWDTLIWNEPAGANALTALAGFDVIMAEMMAARQGGDLLRMAGAGGYATGGTHIPECANDIVPADLDFEQNPVFATSATTLAIPIDATNPPTIFTVHEFRIRGTFIDDGDTIEDFRATGLIDMRGISTLLGGFDPCALFSLAGSDCQACPDGVEECIWTDIEAPEASVDPMASISDWCEI